MKEKYRKLRRSISSGMSRVAQFFGKPRVVILHNHLFKNAGSSIDWALQKYFRQDFVDHRDDEQMRRGKEYLGPYLLANRYIKALSTHHLTMPLPEEEGLRLLTIMMFRHPIERVTSVYSYEKKQTDSTTPGAIQARKLNMKDYILWRMQPEVGCTIRNFHVRKMLPAMGAAKDVITDEKMAIVLKSVADTELLGLVERFDESMVLFEHSLQKSHPRIDLSYKMQNVGQETSKAGQERIESIRAEVGEEVFHMLMENNRRDLELYAWAKVEFERRIARIADFEERLRLFRNRCGRHG